MEETTDWIYGFFSLLSDIISSEGDEDEDDGDEDTDKGKNIIDMKLLETHWIIIIVIFS